MPTGGIVAAASLAYLALLFAVAAWADRRAREGRSVIANPWVYALSLSVYASSWTYYGSVGRAATSGVAFLPVYLGPTLVFAVAWIVIRRMLRVARRWRITSVSDLLATRYGRSARLAALVSLLAVLVLVPYVALQLHAVAKTFRLLVPGAEHGPTLLATALILATFAILFGARTLDPSERHEGLVAAVAVESLVKLGAFLAAGLFATFVLFDGPRDLYDTAPGAPQRLEPVQTLDFMVLTVLSGLAVIVLPRQFQVAVVENVDERHLRRASWAFPLYLLIINLFVLPIAWAGAARVGSAASPDTWVLALPRLADAEGLTLLVFLGGFSAAASMVVVETVALSTMVSKDLLIPLLIRSGLFAGTHVGALALALRRGAIVALMLAGWAWSLTIGDTPLVDVGLISFAGIAQLAPGVLAGLFWRGGTRAGVEAGLLAGGAVWAWTLVVPAFVTAGVLPAGLLTEGPFGVSWLRPGAPGNLEGPSPVTLCVVFSLIANAGTFLGVSALSAATPAELVQAERFARVMRGVAEGPASLPGTSRTTVGQLEDLLSRVVGPQAVAAVLGTDAIRLDDAADGRLLAATEAQLAGVVGGPSARRLLTSLVDADVLEGDEVRALLGEATEAIATSRQLAEQARELELVTRALRENEARLKTILDYTPAMVVLKSLDGRYLFVNPNFEALAGKPADEILGRTAAEVMGPEVARIVEQREREALAAGGPVAREDDYVLSDGRRRTFLTHRVPIPDPAGGVAGLCIISLDITARKDAEEAIRRLNTQLAERAAQLEGVNRELEAFTSSVSHDLRAPLRSIEGFTRLAIDTGAGTLDPASLAYLERAQAAARRMSQLIEDLLSLSRVTRVEMARAPVDLSAAAAAVVADLRAQAPERDVRVEIEPGMVAHGDARLLRIALENLLGNAWKYTSGRPVAHIRFVSGVEDERRVYHVEDDGAGFEMAWAGRLFQVFSRLHGASEFPGTGIGLVTVKRIVERHGGRIRAQGVRGKGATFTFDLGEAAPPGG